MIDVSSIEKVEKTERKQKGYNLPKAPVTDEAKTTKFDELFTFIGYHFQTKVHHTLKRAMVTGWSAIDRIEGA